LLILDEDKTIICVKSGKRSHHFNTSTKTNTDNIILL